MFVTHQSVGLSYTDPANKFCSPSARSSQLVWEIDSSRAPKGSVTPQVICSHVQSKPSRTRRRRKQLEFSSHEPLDADVVDASQPDVVGNAGRPVKNIHNQAGTKHRQTVPKDPNTVGFVPAYILGNMYLCKTPERDSKASVNTDDIKEEDFTFWGGKHGRPPPANLSLMRATGVLGPATGVVGLFASKAVALLVAHETCQQHKLATRGSTEEPVGSRQQQFRDHIKKWRASGLFKLAGAQAWRSRNFSRPDLKPAADPQPDALSSIQTALKEAESVMKHLDEAAEELFMQEESVMRLPLAVGLELVMKRPQGVRLMDLPWRRKGSRMASKNGKKGKGQGKGSVSNDIRPGMATYTIPGISCTMPSSVGPMQFSPLFTSRHTAEMTWGVVREALLTRHLVRRKLERVAQRNAMEMSFAHLSGLASRVETKGSNEDGEGLNEPSEVAEFLTELGEGDPRSSMSNVRFKPRGPLDFLGALACGAISVYARAAEWSGNTADHLLAHSPLGQQGVDMVKRPAIQEQPFHTAIAAARDWNSALQRASVMTQALAHQQVAPYLGQTSAAASESSSTAGSAQHAQRAQQGNAAEGSPGSAITSEQQASGSLDAQRPQRTEHAGQGQQFKSREAKHAQQGAGGPAGQPPGKADESSSGQTRNSASPTQHVRDHSHHHTHQHESPTANGSHAVPEPQPSVHPQSDAQPQVQSMQSGHSMPASLPPMDDLYCVLENGEQLSMLDGLQALATALNISYGVINADRQDKLPSPLELPIMSSKGEESAQVILGDTSEASTTKASICCDMAVASGRKAATKEDSSKMQPAAKAVVLVGDMGFEQYKSASEYVQSKKEAGENAGSIGPVGFGNLSPLVSIVEEQLRQDAQDK